jgi:hypothetical protein
VVVAAAAAASAADASASKDLDFGGESVTSKILPRIWRIVPQNHFFHVLSPTRSSSCHVSTQVGDVGDGPDVGDRQIQSVLVPLRRMGEEFRIRYIRAVSYVFWLLMEEPVPVMGGGKWKMRCSSKSKSRAIDAQIHINVMNLHSSSSIVK